MRKPLEFPKYDKLSPLESVRIDICVTCFSSILTTRSVHTVYNCIICGTTTWCGIILKQATDPKQHVVAAKLIEKAKQEMKLVKSVPQMLLPVWSNALTELVFGAIRDFHQYNAAKKISGEV